MVEQKYDIAVIGSGPGGYVAAQRASELGFKTVCIEKDGSLGGTCLNVGCIPSKSLLHSTEHFSFTRDEAKDYGIIVKELGLDFGKMQSRKTEIVQGLVSGVDGLLKGAHVTVMRGKVKLLSPQRIAIERNGTKEEIEVKHVILATGSEPIALPFLPFDEKRVLSSTGALALEKPPASMLLVGAGVIGVELASVYRRLGAEITVIEMLDRICPTVDAAVGKMLQQILKKQGMNFYLGAKVLKGAVKDNRVELEVDTGQEKKTFSADVALIGIGRRPYKKDLGLEEIGITLDKKGFVKVDGNFRTSVPNVYAIGDLIDGPMLAHKASSEGIAVAEVIAGQARKLNYLAIPNVIYTYPEVAAVGLTEEEAKEKGMQVILGTASFKANARARAMGSTEGMVKVLAERETRRLIGLHILGPSASEMIAAGSIAIVMKATIEDLASICFAHPTLSETIHEAILKCREKK